MPTTREPQRARGQLDNSVTSTGIRIVNEAIQVDSRRGTYVQLRIVKKLKEGSALDSGLNRLVSGYFVASRQSLLNCSCYACHEIFRRGGLTNCVGTGLCAKSNYKQYCRNVAE
jgi:hypothetical protein